MQVLTLVTEAESCASQAVALCNSLQHEAHATQEGSQEASQEGGSQSQTLEAAKQLAVLFARKLYDAVQLIKADENEGCRVAAHQQLRSLYTKYRALLGETLHATLDPLMKYGQI